MHEIPQLVPSQVADPFGTVGHGAQAEPHVAVSELETHAPEQACRPALQVKPQTPPVHVVVPKAIIGQAFVHEPQWFGSVDVSTHERSHRVGVMPEQPLAQAYVPLVPIEQSGVGSEHIVSQRPQFDAVVMSVSQPSSSRSEQ